MEIKRGFVLASVSRPIHKLPTDAELGPLAALVDLQNHPTTWQGRGFNQIWRPFFGTQDRFLELNETIEQLEFDDIPGHIPNRGFLQADINLRGLRYLQ